MSSFQEKVRRFFKNKLVLCCVGSLIFWGPIYLYCTYTGNNYEPKADRPEQKSIGKLCDFATLKEFGAPAKSGDATPFFIDDEIDGPKPAMEMTSIRTFSNLSEIKAFYEKSCKRLGFVIDEPGKDSGNNMSCTKNDRFKDETLIVEPRCNNTECTIFLEVHKF